MVLIPTGEQESDVLKYLKRATRKGLTPKEAWDIVSEVFSKLDKMGE